jgi:hypothetical protein
MAEFVGDHKTRSSGAKARLVAKHESRNLPAAGKLKCDPRLSNFLDATKRERQGPSSYSELGYPHP